MKRAETHESTEDKAAGREHEIGIFESLWKLFSSMRTAIVLFLLLIAVSVVYTLFQYLGLMDMYHSVWYKFLLSLVGLNVLNLFIHSLKWEILSSMKTAIVLLLLLAALSVIGTIIAQNTLFMEYIKVYWPGIYVLFIKLGLADMYHSVWYKLMLLLVGWNLSACSINRFKIMWRRAYRPKVSTDAAKISGMQRSEKISSVRAPDDTVDNIGKVLRARAYRIFKEQENGDTLLYAAKGTASLWGPYLTHLSILVIFVGAILGGILGFNGYTTITEGKSTNSYYLEGSQQETKLGFRVALKKFYIEHDGKHNPTAYKSDLEVYEKDKLVAQKLIDVNQPLTYKGVSFFQSDYGLTGFVLKITAPNGDSVRVPFNIETGSGEFGKEYRISESPFKQVEIGGKKLTVFVHDFAPDYIGGPQVNMSFLPVNPAANIMINDRFPEYKGLDAWSKLGWLSQSKSVNYKGITITLDDVVDYTGLQVSQNPGLPVIYIGFGLLLMGIFLSFYITHMVIRIRISSTSSVQVGAISRADPSIFDRDFERLRNAITQ